MSFDRISFFISSLAQTNSSDSSPSINDLRMQLREQLEIRWRTSQPDERTGIIDLYRVAISERSAKCLLEPSVRIYMNVLKCDGSSLDRDAQPDTQSNSQTVEHSDGQDGRQSEDTQGRSNNERFERQSRNDWQDSVIVHCSEPLILQVSVENIGPRPVQLLRRIWAEAGPFGFEDDMCDADIATSVIINGVQQSQMKEIASGATDTFETEVILLTAGMFRLCALCECRRPDGSSDYYFPDDQLHIQSRTS